MPGPGCATLERFWGRRWPSSGGDGEGLRQGFGILILPRAQGCRQGSSGRWQGQGHAHVSPGWDGMPRGSARPGAPCTQRDESGCGSRLWENAGQGRPCQRLGTRSGLMASHHPAPASATPASRALGVLALHRTLSREGAGAVEVGVRVGPWVWKRPLHREPQEGRPGPFVGLGWRQPRKGP